MLQRLITRIRHIVAKKKIRRYEQVFHYGDHVLKYCYVPCKNTEVLAVIFSGFPAEGKPAAYNMVSSFNGLKVNRLFVLDNFGFQKRGAYYMSENGDFYVRDMVLALLRQFPSKKRVFLGSSKGGTAAVYFGLLNGADEIIAGAPQLFLGGYLTDKQSHIPILDAMAGDHTPESIDKYNCIVPDVIKSASNCEKTRVLLHYSKLEHTYQAHILPMIELLEQYGYSVEHDEEQYLEHADVAKYFPSLCKKRLQSIVSECKFS